METESIDIRRAVPADAAGIARVYVDTWRASYAEILPAPFLARMSVARQTRSWLELIGHDEVMVAVRGERVLAVSSAGPERTHDPFFRAEIFALYVAPDEQRQGLGAALVVEMLRRLPAPVLVWVLADNAGGCAFYEALGAVPVRRRPERVGGGDFEVVGYAWFDVG